MAALHDALAGLGASLRTAGLTGRALAAWAGTSRIAALPARLDAIRARPPTPADAMLALFVAGAELAAARLRMPAAVLDALAAHALIERDGDRIRARVAIVPLGAALLVCDRLDAPVERDRVSWPDDSSHHLATALPVGRRARWLDLACGSAYAALARPELATQISAVDLNERAVRHATLGARLSGIAQLACEPGDIGDHQPPADLVTCNAPIPPAAKTEAPEASDAAERWRHAEPGFFDRLWPALRVAVRPGGMIVLHAAHDALLAALGDAEGERVVVTYTPDHVRAFAIAWWRPDAPARFAAWRRLLDVDRPHVDPADREAALVLA
ncbi:MAG: methyltransferase [Kofleriaceae bacterium]